MSFEIILLILLAALLHASWNAVIKGGSNKLYETGLNCFGGGVGRDQRHCIRIGSGLPPAQPGGVAEPF